MAIGLKAVDSLMPVGRGQHEFVIGGRQTRKTTTAIDSDLDQRSIDESKDVKAHLYFGCVATGQERPTVSHLFEIFR